MQDVTSKQLSKELRSELDVLINNLESLIFKIEAGKGEFDKYLSLEQQNNIFDTNFSRNRFTQNITDQISDAQNMYNQIKFALRDSIESSSIEFLKRLTKIEKEFSYQIQKVLVENDTLKTLWFAIRNPGIISRMNKILGLIKEIKSNVNDIREQQSETKVLSKLKKVIQNIKTLFSSLHEASDELVSLYKTKGKQELKPKGNQILKVFNDADQKSIYLINQVLTEISLTTKTILRIAGDLKTKVFSLELLMQNNEKLVLAESVVSDTLRFANEILDLYNYQLKRNTQPQKFELLFSTDSIKHSTY